MMAQQRRNLLIGGLVGTLLLAFLGYRMFLAPLAELNKEYDKASDEAEAKEKEWKAFNREKKKLEYIRLLGLPLSAEEGVTKYELYLRTIFEDTGLPRKAVDITVPKDAEMRAQQAPKKGQPSHIVRTFQVKARISWPRLLQFLAKFRETPLLHRIKTFTIERPSGTVEEATLNVSMAIETLTVAAPGQKTAPGRYDPQARPDNLWGVDVRVVALDALASLAHAPAGWAMVLRAQALLVPETPAGRHYADLNQRNPFFGPGFAADGKKIPDTVKKPVEKDPSKTAPGETINVLKYLKFELFSGEQQNESVKREVSLRNYLRPLAAGKDAWVTLTGSSNFEIFDEEGQKPVLKGKVLRIDQRDVYFQVGESIYCIQLEQTLREAMWDDANRKSKALSRARLEELGLLKVVEPVEKDGKRDK